MKRVRVTFMIGVRVTFMVTIRIEVYDRTRS